ncbi:macrolide ABC transporter ATP-binding protein [Candidatus Curtissbacteria bacterium RIFCSPLOWO2_01_FULL_41_18]|uniref:Macrolide ABC transporter ATP-binding protein n=2 Tax=Candidatus Curtissiibacteriota TaxID=1752717 RepID=A0A1F5FZ93_9BACT|nr:MAG: macrolide ABC transporter ATP-binding protein [Candidatus Curtissbacteria bacterium RIFCSPHIGHO2_01_FULL_41_13]OGE03604.1 MAG: macrolide ABC transporter ATP-binding protein [Candidatus Curtissbacteria bacterium RIFCSPLOWO2_01_FULL_41_18]
MNVLIDAGNLQKTYGEGESKTEALKKVSIKVRAGEFVAIIGPSGSGKSTLMNILGCLDRPDSGNYLFENRDIGKLSDIELAKIRNRKIGFVFQAFNLLARTSALKNVELPLIYSGVKQDERNTRAMQVLEDVNLSDKLKSTPAQLSGGQQQRVAIARALINNPLVIFADEPTGNLDTKSSNEIMEIFKKLNEKGRTIVMITHEKDIAQRAARIITMRDGQITSDKKNLHKKRNITQV